MNTKDCIVMAKFIRKFYRRVLSILVSIVLVLGMIPVSGTLVVCAMPQNNDYVNSRPGNTDGSNGADGSEIPDSSDSADGSEVPDSTGGIDDSDGADSADGVDDSKGCDTSDSLFSIVTSAGNNGTVTPSEASIPSGDNRNITADAEPGYRIAAFTVDGAVIIEAEGVETYTYPFDHIDENHTVDVTFADKSWEVSFTFNSDGTIMDGDSNPVESGGKITAGEGENPGFTAEADSGYHISSVKIDSILCTDGTFDNDQTIYSYTFPDIRENHSVTVSFSINTYIIDIELIGNGTAFVGDDPADEVQTINHGETLTLTFIPSKGYDIKEILLDGAQSDTYDLMTDDITYTYDISSVLADHTLSVEFAPVKEGKGDETDFYEVAAEGLLDGYPLVSGDRNIYSLSNKDGSAILVPKTPYTRIRINEQENVTSVPITNTILIENIEVYKPDQPDKGWTIVPMERPLQIIVDQTAPVVAEIPPMDWTNKDFTVQGEVTDEDIPEAPSSGLANVVWSKSPLSEEQALKEAANITPISNGKYSFTIATEQNNETFYIYAIDKAGNVSAAQTINLKIDKTRPEIIEFTFQKLEHSAASRFINFFTYGTFYHDNIEVIISGQDAGSSSSGLKEITLYSDSVKIETKPVQGDSAVFMLTRSDFKDNEIRVSVKDIAGNESMGRTGPTAVKTNAYSDKVSLKTEKPVISITATEKALFTRGGENWYDGDTGFDVNVSTESGGIYSVIIKVNDKVILKDKNGKDINANFYESQTLQELFTVNTDMNSLEGENIIEVTAVNNYGNEETVSIKAFIDTTNPEIVGFQMEKKNDNVLSRIIHFLTFGNFFNEKVVITVHADDHLQAGSGINTMSLFVDGAELENSPVSATETGDGTYQAKFILPEEVIADVKQLDVALSASAIDNIGHITGQDDDHPEGIQITPSSVNSELKSDRLIIETIKPVVEMLSPEPMYTDSMNRKWYIDDVAFMITVQDEDAGIQSVQIRINGKDIPADMEEKPVNTAFYETQTHEETFLVNTSQGERAADGSYLVEVIVMDNAGNQYTASDIVYKDTDAPVIEEYQFVPTASDGIGNTSEFVNNLEYEFYFNEEVDLTIQVVDPGPSSGLNTLTCRLVSCEKERKIKETSETVSIVDGRAVLTIPQGFKGQIYAEAVDNTAHLSEEKAPKGFVVDHDTPDINIEYNNTTNYQDAEGNKLYVGSMSFTVEVADYESGIGKIGYSQNSEKNSEEKNILVNNTGYRVGDLLEDDWEVAEMDANLVTKATKTFTLDTDDNGIVFTFEAADRSLNRKQNVETDKMTCDITPPVIYVAFREDAPKNNDYYSSNRIADIRVTERNFDSNLINVLIENQFGEIPELVFSSESNTEHAAVIDFGEGDYTFDLTGTDLGNQEAVVHFSGENEKLFYVDKTRPIIEDNFGTFSKPGTKDSFNTDKTVEIHITEHNFSPELVNLSIKKKEPGSNHTTENLYDISWEILSGIEWDTTGDYHSISFTLSEDGVYQIDMSCADLAQNSSETKSTVVFEIDQTAPVVRSRNGMPVEEDDSNFLAIYSYEKKEEPAPTVEFDDLNIDHIRYEMSFYIPEKDSTQEGTVIRPVRTYLEEDPEKSGVIKGSGFELPEFTKDGVYTLELTAVDAAGNESLVNVNTYARMVEQDVLAYIMESNVTDQTGIYSFQYENGEPVSKRPDNFSDIKIQVLARRDSDVNIVLRDNNADEINTYAQAETDHSIYGIGIYNYTVRADFFKEKFQGDTDAELQLAVNNAGNRIDLGRLHIDNIAPECRLPEEFRSWSWYYGEEARTITISDISELIDEEQCRVYDNGKEIAFSYSGSDNTIEFTLEKGWHNVGVILDDVAGNANNIQEKVNIHIGFFWLWVILASSVTGLTALVCAVLFRIRKKNRLEKEY